MNSENSHEKCVKDAIKSITLGRKDMSNKKVVIKMVKSLKGHNKQIQNNCKGIVLNCLCRQFSHNSGITCGFPHSHC